MDGRRSMTQPPAWYPYDERYEFSPPGRKHTHRSSKSRKHKPPKGYPTFRVSESLAQHCWPGYLTLYTSKSFFRAIKFTMISLLDAMMVPRCSWVKLTHFKFLLLVTSLNLQWTATKELNTEWELFLMCSNSECFHVSRTCIVRFTFRIRVAGETATAILQMMRDSATSRLGTSWTDMTIG